MASSDIDQWQTNTNLSRSISLTILDRQGIELPIQTANNESIELIIARDPNRIVPSMHLQNVTRTNRTSHKLIFNLHYIDLQRSKMHVNQTCAVHIEFGWINTNMSYVLVYRFEQVPQLNTSTMNIDGWTSICSSCKFNIESTHMFLRFVRLYF
jgi:hypothetical protein